MDCPELLGRPANAFPKRERCGLKFLLFELQGGFDILHCQTDYAQKRDGVESRSRRAFPRAVLAKRFDWSERQFYGSREIRFERKLGFGTVTTT